MPDRLLMLRPFAVLWFAACVMLLTSAASQKASGQFLRLQMRFQSENKICSFQYEVKLDGYAQARFSLARLGKKDEVVREDIDWYDCSKVWRSSVLASFVNDNRIPEMSHRIESSPVNRRVDYPYGSKRVFIVVRDHGRRYSVCDEDFFARDVTGYNECWLGAITQLHALLSRDERLSRSNSAIALKYLK